MYRVIDLAPVALWSRLVEFGGYTVDPWTGETPAVGFAVSVSRFERTYEVGMIKPEHILDGLNDAKSARSSLGVESAIYAGAWNDPASGLVYLDTSIVVQSESIALDHARRWGQIAVYDMLAGRTVYTSDLAVGL